jgi:hypothetical protein
VVRYDRLVKFNLNNLPHMKTKLFVLLLLAAAILFSACASRDTAESSTVQQTEIFQDYLADWSDGQFTVTATFRFGGPTGTTLKLTPPSRVAYNGIDLPASKGALTGTIYRFTSSTYQPNLSFEFRDTAGKPYLNSIDLVPVEFAVPPTKAAKASRVVLPITRIVGESDTTGYLTLTDSAGDDHIAEVKVSRGAVSAPNSVYFDQGSIVLEPEFLKGISAGAGKVALRIERKQTPAQVTHLGGSIAVRYQVKPIALTLTN